MLFGNKIRELRDEQGLLQRQLDVALEIDTPMFSKIERGDRRAKREQVIKLAELLHQDKNEMLKLWLADKVIDAVAFLCRKKLGCSRAYSKVVRMCLLKDGIAKQLRSLAISQYVNVNGTGSSATSGNTNVPNEIGRAHV